MKSFLTCVFVLSFISIYAQPNPSWESKVDTDLVRQFKRGNEISFIVLLRAPDETMDGFSLGSKNQKAIQTYQHLKSEASSSQKKLSKFLLDEEVQFKSLYIVNAILVENGSSILEEIAKRTEVKFIYSNRAIRKAKTEEIEIGNSRGGEGGITWGIEKMGVDKVWEMGYRGQNVVVGGQDTGYKWDHPALKNAYRGYNLEADTADHNYNWYDAIHNYNPAHGDTLNACGLDSQVPCDDNGHGTHTMGTMIGLEEETNEQIGLAPESVWCACRNMERGWGTLFTYLECFQWFLAPTDLNGNNPDPTKAPHVINNSWGCPEDEGCNIDNWDILDIAVNNLRQAGTVVVVSAGNDGSDCETVTSPAAIFQNSFSIGATAENDTIAGFSSRGGVAVDLSYRIKPNVSAPGVRVRSARLDNGYGNSSGTSMAGPHVAGLVALMISANPELAGQVEVIEDIIESTSDPKTTDQECSGVSGSSIPNNTYGFGRVNALAAVEAALAYIPSSTQEIGAFDFQMWPNPLTDNLTIRFQDESNEKRIIISDLQGRIRNNQTVSSGVEKATFDFGPYEPGVYVVMIEDQGLRVRKLVIKQ